MGSAAARALGRIGHSPRLHLACSNPFGTVIGVYTMWVFLPAIATESRQWWPLALPKAPECDILSFQTTAPVLAPGPSHDAMPQPDMRG